MTKMIITGNQAWGDFPRLILVIRIIVESMAVKRQVQKIKNAQPFPV
jgi:hypothetical protein